MGKDTRRRIKRLLGLLKELQAADHPITDATMVAVKYLLQSTSKCSLVETELFSGGQGPLDFNCPLPRFIESQLQAQRLTGTDSSGVDIAPLLTVVLASLAQPFSTDNKAFPTVFRWYSALRHRYYYLFAYIQDDMEHRTYNVDELMALRHGQVSSGVPILAANPELGMSPNTLGPLTILTRTFAAEIIRSSGSESSADATKRDSSSSDDVLLYKGRAGRRLLSKSSRDRETAQQAPMASVPKVFNDPSRLPAHPEAANETLQDPAPKMQTEWKYRGRSDSEAAAGDPSAAPTGIPAQKSEGFQRFFKAVVSPTHVRVTAGGRIVPNTRGPPSPTSKRDRDTDTQSISDKAAPGKPSIGQIGMNPPPGMNPQVNMMPHLLAGYPPGFQPMQTPMQFLPMAFGAPVPPGYPFAQPSASPTASVFSQGGKENQKDLRNKNPGESQGEEDTTSDQDKTKVTQPEFFDYSKPFFYNGHYMYPVPAAAFPSGMPGQGMPIQMVGVPTGVTPMPGMMPASPAGVPTHAPFYHGGPTPPAFAMQAHRMPPQNVPVLPPKGTISSIKPSDITRKQIQSFKQSLKYHEDQLQYNRHQIDEKEIEGRILTIRGHIQRFEMTLKTQQEYEDSMRRTSDQDKDGKASVGPSEDKQPKPPRPQVTEQEAIDHAEIDRRYQIAVGKFNQAQHEKSARRGVRTDKTTEPVHTEPVYAKSTQEAPSFTRDQARQAFHDHLKAGGLPSDAALAPVFKPRAYASSSCGGSEHSRDAQEATEQRLLSTGNWKPLAFEQGTGNWKPNSAKSQRSSSQVSGSHQPGPPPFDPRPAKPTMSRPRPGLGVPYLLGTLPKGVNPRTADDKDYIYKRPLTDEEQRSRYLYWGQAPKSVTRGLPKYDGKHFYPPSPVMEAATPTEGPQVSGRGSKSPADPFRSLTPVNNAGKGHFVTEEQPALRRVNAYDPMVMCASEDLRASEDSISQGSSVQMPAAALKGRENSADAALGPGYDRRVEKPRFVNRLL